jgi:hypothetical protein
MLNRKKPPDMPKGRKKMQPQEVAPSGRVSIAEAKRMLGDPEMDTRTLKRFLHRHRVRTTSITDRMWSIVRYDLEQAITNSTYTV